MTAKFLSVKPTRRSPHRDPAPKSPANSGRLLRTLGVLTLLTLTSVLSAQQFVDPPSSVDELPNAPGFTQTPLDQPAQQPDQLQPGTISGVVQDSSGAVVTGARITLTGDPPSTPRVDLSEANGHFTFLALPPGAFHLAITAPGLATWSWSGILPPGKDLVIPGILMQIPSAIADVEVRAARTEVAAAQVELEEKQRVLGIFPNFYAVYIWNAASLTSRQKFGLAWKSAVDPVSFGVTGLVAGIQQSQDAFKGYGQGAQGYAKRYAANYADGFISNMIGGAILPSLFHQDPRYFVKGAGSIRSRALYAIATTVICKGDNGHWQPNYSNVLGNITSAGISNAYYPASDRNGASLTLENSLIGTAGGAISSLIQEFFLRKITPHIPNYGAGNPNDPSQPAPSPQTGKSTP